MDFFSDPEFIKLAALGCAFVVGVSICIYVAIRETAELNRRRRASLSLVLPCLRMCVCLPLVTLVPPSNNRCKVQVFRLPQKCNL